MEASKPLLGPHLEVHFVYMERFKISQYVSVTLLYEVQDKVMLIEMMGIIDVK